jgi:dipeptidyl aminopeptidase/acylaminoacyl peptidase
MPKHRTTAKFKNLLPTSLALLVTTCLTLSTGRANPNPPGCGSAAACATNQETAKAPKPRTPAKERRSVTVADTIRMNRIAGTGAMNSYGGGLTENFAAFSPDGRRFVFVLKQGILAQNANSYSLLLYQVERLRNHPVPTTLVSFAASSNREAITEVTWLDNDTILFLGEQGNDTRQLYSVRLSSGAIRKLTSHPSSLLSYSASSQARRIAYEAEINPEKIVNEGTLRRGFRPSGEMLSDLILGTSSLKDNSSELFVMERGKHTVCLNVPDRVDVAPFFLSPDGRFLVVTSSLRTKPPTWGEYQDKGGLLHSVWGRVLPEGALTWLLRYEVVDTFTGKSRVLVDGPKNYYGSEVRWLPDSRSVVLTGAYLPLDVADEGERLVRKTHPFAVEVSLPDLAIRKIGNEDLKFLSLDSASQTLKFEVRAGRGQTAAKRLEYFQRRGTGWAPAASPRGSDILPEIIAEQDINTPPRVAALNPKTGQRTLLLDLNPQFRALKFGMVRIVTWSDDRGRQVEGGLYLPPDYVPGVRYPLVIQTHGFDRKLFFIDGPFSTAFAAQPLAGKGIVVLQVPGPPDSKLSGTPEEGPNMMKVYENAIDFLDTQGIIDRNRVGLIGFSQTCFHVQYTLTHSTYRFAAAVVADGLDGGYFQYLAFANSTPYLTVLEEDTNGGIPFGVALPRWIQRAPGFLLDRVQTPVLLQAIAPASLLEEWEWFAGLRRLGKPVDLLYIPTGSHILQKPWDRMISQESAVEWLAFWLKGEENSSPAKAAQYQLWRALRQRQKQQTASDTQSNVEKAPGTPLSTKAPRR